VIVYLRLQLICPLLSASRCWRLYWLQIWGMSLTLTQPRRLCLFRVLLGATATVTSLPFCKHTGGGGATLTFSGRLVYLQFTWEVPLPHSPVEHSLQYCHKLSCSKVAGRGLPLLQFHEGLPLPLRCLGHPALFAMCFLLLLFII
jgi:hypothetical protein